MLFLDDLLPETVEQAYNRRYRTYSLLTENLLDEDEIEIFEDLCDKLGITMRHLTNLRGEDILSLSLTK